MPTAWRYGARPDKELRWYPEGAWLGWRPLGSPVASEFETIDGFSLAEYLERVRHTGVVESDFLLPPKSGDSWGAFVSRHGDYNFYDGYVPEHLVQDAKRDKLRARVTAEQEAWEEARRERMRLKQEASDAEWAEAQRKVEETARVLAIQRAEQQAKREARKKAELEMARFRYAAELPDRMHWLSLFQHTLSELRGSKYEALMPEMERDMRTIVDYPPGPLPWRLDRDVFYRSLAEKKARIDKNG